jgi:predicted nucleic acid-binding protein
LKFIDTNVIVRAFTQNEDSEKCKTLLNSQFVTNTLCLVEAQHMIATIKGNKKIAADAIKSLFRGDAIIAGFDKNLLFQSYRRIGQYDLNIFDLIAYLTAIINHCSEFVSYDKDFDNLEIKRTEP